MVRVAPLDENLNVLTKSWKTWSQPSPACEIELQHAAIRVASGIVRAVAFELGEIDDQIVVAVAIEVITAQNGGGIGLAAGFLAALRGLGDGFGDFLRRLAGGRLVGRPATGRRQAKDQRRAKD